MHTTSLSLIEGLRSPHNAPAWERFVELYTPLFFRWARTSGLQPNDAADLVQDVFALLLQKMPEFHYDAGKSFRAWLRTVMGNLRRDRDRAIATRPLPGSDSRLPEVSIADPIELIEDEEYRRYLVGRALQLIQADFEPSTWRAVWMHAVEGRPAPAVAAKIGMTTAAVYCAKFRVLNRLRRELQGLID